MQIDEDAQPQFLRPYRHRGSLGGAAMTVVRIVRRIHEYPQPGGIQALAFEDLQTIRRIALRIAKREVRLAHLQMPARPGRDPDEPGVAMS